MNNFMEEEGWTPLSDFGQQDPGLNILISIHDDITHLISKFPDTKYLVAIIRHYPHALDKGIMSNFCLLFEGDIDEDYNEYNDVAKMELILKDLATIVETSPSANELEEASKQLLYDPEEEEAEEEEEEKSGDKRARK